MDDPHNFKRKNLRGNNRRYIDNKENYNNNSQDQSAYYASNFNANSRM